MHGTARRLSRRQWLRGMVGTSATIAAPEVIPATAVGGAGRPPASQRIAIGFLGVGGHGLHRNLGMFLQQPDAQPVALCDADGRQLPVALRMVQQKLGAGYRCQLTRDWREVIARNDVDAVMISTPDHWHVPMSVAAIRAGKDVICEKPTLTIAEGRLLVETVKRYGAVFQLSTEDRSLAVYHRMAELVRNERIGKLQRIVVGLPTGPSQVADPTPQPIPKELDYEMWLGPAPWAPYCPARLPFNWRWVSDYSGGMLTDWGAHLLDTAQWANNTERTGPIEVWGTGKRPPGGLYDTFYEFHLHYTYANGVQMEVHSGGVRLRLEGTDGWIESTGWIGPLTASSPEILRATLGPHDVRLFTCPEGEHRNFLDCVKTRRDPYFPAEVGHRCCSVAHLGNIALALGRKLRWDPQSECFPDDLEANRLLSRAMRQPWTL